MNYASLFDLPASAGVTLTVKINSAILHFGNEGLKFLFIFCLLILASAPAPALIAQEGGSPVQIEEAGVLEATGLDEVLDLSGSVRLLHGGTVLTSDRVNYNRLNRIVRLTGNVYMIREDSTLRADEVIYFESNQRAIGIGEVQLNDKKDGVLLTGDRMEYSKYPHRAVATGQPGMIWQQNDSEITIKGKRLEYYFSESNTLLKALAKDSVVVADDDEGFRIYCERVEYFKSTDSALFTGKPRLAKRKHHQDNDIDIALTGTSMTYTFGERTVNVFNSVRITRGALVGECDTLRYHSEGQKIELQSNPVIRSNFSEIAGENIILNLVEGRVARAVVTGRAVGAYAARSTKRLQQSTIEGQNMVVDFHREAIKKITASGNAISNYNPSTFGNGPAGHNIVTANEIVIELDEGEPVKVRANGDVDGTYFVPDGVEKNR